MYQRSRALTQTIRSAIFVAVTAFCTIASVANVSASEEQHAAHEHEHDHEHEHPEDTEHSGAIELPDNQADMPQITTAIAGAAELKTHISTFGTVRFGAEQLFHIAPRFDGVITQVQVAVGDYVNKGDLLATLESNDSLRAYPLRAPAEGKVIEQLANSGDLINSDTVFVVAAPQPQWLELRIYPAQARQIKEKQLVLIPTGEGVISRQIEHIIPQPDAPYRIARIKLPAGNTLTTGQWVEAQIEASSHTLPLAVEKSAVHTIDRQTGVYVREGNAYHFTPLSLGRENSALFEVAAGLEVGAEYATENSYLLKAEQEKSSAEHSH
ncbi:efflux RND transporter periplasmic adaptor subunit [Teredinibacter turnerae]|uniref:efflux RND transporter periplasmic adaptor subunit n=1 Tax=Teredinibacter turnerae TaxID=2426 RepID=UPI000366D45B|nr:efflux RND transporter periplasmic adaptor subunit [Teredinibacter turnerae]